MVIRDGPLLPGDVVQIVLEYVASVVSLMQCRAVSQLWGTATEEAVGFINGREWSELNLGAVTPRHPLQRHFAGEPAGRIIAMSAICLAPRLTRVVIALPSWVSATPLLRSAPALESLHVTTLRSRNGRTTAVDGNSAADDDETGTTLDSIGLYLVELDLSESRWCGHLLATLAASNAGIPALLPLRVLTAVESDVTKHHLPLLARFSQLDTLNLTDCRGIDDVAPLAACTALRHVTLSGTKISSIAALDDLPHLATLIVSRCSHLAVHLSNAPSLVELDVSDSRHTSGTLDVGPVAARLQRLDVSRSPVYDLSQLLSPMTSLRHLRAADMYIRSVKGIETVLPALESLTLHSWSLDSVEGLAPCVALRELSLVSCICLHDVSALAGLPALQKLDLQMCRGLYDVTSLAACPALTDLCLAANTLLPSSIPAVATIQTLQVVDFGACHDVIDVSCFRDSVTLRKINLHATTVTTSGIAGLECIPTLEHLALSDCEVLQNVTALRVSRSLTHLDLSGSGVTSSGLAGVEEIPTLTYLDLAQCGCVTTAVTLARCPVLKVLDLSGTNVGPAGIVGLERIDTLEWLGLQSCRSIVDVSAFTSCRALQTIALAGSGVIDTRGLEHAATFEY
jgi:Leucine-rich repeat (LRR) protein